MKISDIMTKGVVVISADSSLYTAAQSMEQNDIGAVPVQDGGVLKGMITDRDIVVRGIAKGLDPRQTSVADIMSTDLATCSPGDDVNMVIQDMKERKVRRIVVVDRNGKPSGIVSLGDIAAHADVKIAAEALKRVSQPVHSG